MEIDSAVLAGMRRAMRRKIMLAVLIATLGAGASAASCVGQGISYRQMKAIEAISEKCGVAAVSR